MSGKLREHEAPPRPMAPATLREAPSGLLRWLPVAGLCCLLLALVRGAGAGISDPDTPWHILAGDYLRRTWHFVGPDPLSTFTTERWVLNQWLPELVMSLANQWGGLRAVAWLGIVGILSVCTAVYAACRRQAGPLGAAVACALAIVGAAPSLSPRPQLVGFVLLAVTVDAWLATVADLRPRWWLVPLSWVWASSHGTWVVGVAVGGVVMAGLRADGRISWRQIGRLGVIPLLSVLASLCTPVGPALWSSFGAVQAVSPYIQEWRRPSLTDGATLAVLLAVAIVVLVWSLRSELSWARAGLLVLGLGWALMYTRTVAVGAIIVAPLAAGAIDLAVRRRRPNTRTERWVVAAAWAAAAALAAVLAAHGPTALVGVPSRMTSTLRHLPAQSVVWNDDALGGWLMRTEPQLRHTADTRAELYGPDGARRYLRVVSAAKGWESDFDSVHPSVALVGTQAPLVRALEHRGWTVRARAAGYVLLAPASADGLVRTVAIAPR